MEERQIMKHIALLRSIQIRITQILLLKMTWLFYATITRTVKIVLEVLSAQYYTGGLERSLNTNWVLQALMQNVCEYNENYNTWSGDNCSQPWRSNWFKMYSSVCSYTCFLIFKLTSFFSAFNLRTMCLYIIAFYVHGHTFLCALEQNQIWCPLAEASPGVGMACLRW